MSTETELSALVVYESMFGCTRDVAAAGAAGLRMEGAAVLLVDVRDAAHIDETRADLLVVGAPTHAFSLSSPATRQDAVRQGAPPEAARTGLREWIPSARRRSDRPLAAAFDTRVVRVRRLPMAAATRAAHLLSRKGYDLVSRPTAFLVHDTPGPIVDGELGAARTWGRTLAQSTRDRLSAGSTSR